jgi:ATP-dependent 26S proteasome regulatory subunit
MTGCAALLEGFVAVAVLSWALCDWLQIVSQLLRFIEGFEGATNTTIVFATNRLAGLDPALLSRCSSVLHFPLPDAVSRASIWKL